MTKANAVTTPKFWFGVKWEKANMEKAMIIKAINRGEILPLMRNGDFFISSVG